MSRGSFLGTPETAPGPTGPRMLGDIGAIRRDPLSYLASTWRRHGDIVQFPIPRPPSYLVNDPDAVRRVLVVNARAYGKDTIQYRSLALVTGDGLLASDGEAWRRQRRLVQPAFHRSTLEALVTRVHSAAGRLTDRWQRLPSGTVVDVEADMLTMSLDVVGHALFGTDLSAAAEEISTATLEALDVVVARARVPITPPGWLPSPANRRLQRSVRVLDAAVRAMVDDRRSTDSAAAADMLELLLQTTDGDRLTEAEVRNEVVTFIVAGHETVASALTWTLALLAEHPEVAQRLAEESDRVLDGRAANLGDLRRLEFTRAVLDEALRLYPPAWLITRRALEGDVLADVDVPESSLVVLSPWLLHRHPDRWGQPDRFLPDRFVDADVDRSAFIPFGAGPRQCIGRDFAYLEAVLVLATLAGLFTVAYPRGCGIPRANPSVTLRPRGGLSLRVVHR